MSDEWKQVSLKEVCSDISYGYTASASDRDFGVKFLRITDIVNKPIKWNQVPSCIISEKDIQKYRLGKGDIVIARTGATTGYNYTFNSQLPSVFASYLIRYKIDTGLADPFYVGYNLQGDNWKGFVENIIGGSAQPGANAQQFASFEFNLPPLPEQQAIAEVLSSLDDKIDLLHRNNKTLEEMAEIIIKEFIIIENKNGFKLKDYVLTANTGLDAIKRAPIVERETGVKCLRIQDVSQEKPFIKWGNTQVEEGNFKKFQLKKHDIIMARTCTPGINFIAREDMPAVFNNGLVRIRANAEKTHPLFLYYLFKSRDFIGHIDGISGGTSVQLNMQIGDLLNFEVSLADEKTQAVYLPLILKLDSKINNNIKQLDKLKETRDTLLPKLMSGQVRVNH